MVSRPVTVNELLDGHVALDLECLDRIYLNAYVPNLQTSGQVVWFLTRHLGNPVASPALFDKIGQGFRRAVDNYAKANDIPVVRFAKGDRKVEVMRPHLERAAAAGTSRVAAIGVAQEFQQVFTGSRCEGGDGEVPRFSFAKADRRVTCYYFYLWDEDFGSAFIKVCSYFPYPSKIWVNGHEWAKRQAAGEGLAFTELANGFASCADPAKLQDICDRLGPDQITAFAERWWARLPLPLSGADRAGGYWWELSMRQVEVSRTLVFDAPRHGRAFFDELVRENLDLGRPDQVELIFGRKVRADTPGEFSTRVVTRGVDVTVNVAYKHSRIKQYFKEGRALRIETVVNDPGDLGCKRRLCHLGELQARARDANRRLLDYERVGQGCVLASPAFARVAQPTVEDGGRRAPALRFGDPRVHALAGTLATFLSAVTGFTNRSLRAQVACR